MLWGMEGGGDWRPHHASQVTAVNVRQAPWGSGHWEQDSPFLPQRLKGFGPVSSPTSVPPSLSFLFCLPGPLRLMCSCDALPTVEKGRACGMVSALMVILIKLAQC